jgi:hypothetical protein
MEENSIEKPKAVQVIPAERSEEGYVVLPYNEGDFREFIKSLLGSPQAINKNIRGSFDIEPSDIRNLHLLILQRITQQNEGILAQFSAKIIFSDYSSVELKSIEELLTYNEVRPIISKAIHLKWDFLVKFQDKKVPEKQSIQMSFVSSETQLTKISGQLVSIERAQFLEYGDYIRSGLISFRIEHTARTWGADIESMLTNYVTSILKTQPKIEDFFRSKSGTIGFISGLLLFLSSTVGSLIATRKYSEIQAKSIEHILQTTNSASIEAVNAKVEGLANYLATNPWIQFNVGVVIFITLSVVVALVVGSWIGDALENYTPSFILLTKLSYQEKEKTLKARDRQWIHFIGGIVLNIILGIVSNIIFSFVFIK